MTLDDCATIGCISRPQYLPGFKSRLPLSSDEHDGNRSWEASELANLEEQTIGETTGTRTEAANPWRSGAPPESESTRTLRTAADPGS
ncbi:hypothetical protein NDU88_001242 [Pleurodeles waltl]|uniref:Uncharacterized protein n=1 Tax=Pleurodeles waltl TaxID=8319 RepID=A0AAV7LFC4_PLEWA|nr:hypothetical protein NDU88_001242 [Pleurodeles waltl]